MESFECQTRPRYSFEVFPVILSDLDDSTRACLQGFIRFRFTVGSKIRVHYLGSAEIKMGISGLIFNSLVFALTTGIFSS